MLYTAQGDLYGDQFCLKYYKIYFALEADILG